MTLRLFWRRFHLWIGVVTGVFLLAITLSGVILMFETKVSRLLNPSLYAVTGPAVAQPLDVYLARAKEAVPNADPAQVRWPEEEGLPVLVLMRLKDAGRQAGETGQQNAAERHGDRAERMAMSTDGTAERGHRERGEGGRNGGGQPAAQGGRPRVVFTYLDPPTGAVLGTAEPRASLIGLVHSLHTDLLMPAFGGRQIVGWMGAGLFILCLSGLYLWWPRNAGFMRGLHWRRGPATTTNLHHSVGFWIVVPLGIMAFTGMIQGFQQQSRAVMGAIVPTTAQPMRQGNGPLSRAVLSPQQAVDAALADAAGFHPTSLVLPTEPGKTWRVQAANDAGDTRTFLIDDASQAVTSPPQPLQGDSTLAFLRRIHEGHHDGPIWETIVFLAGAAPPLLFVTGVIMWLRRRRNVKRLKESTRPASSLQRVAVN